MRVATSEPRSPSPATGVGMVVWLASELMFFAGLFAAYFTLRSVNPVWPPDGVDLPVPRMMVATGVLLASSVTMHRAVLAARAGAGADARRMVVGWLGVTLVLGLVFMGNQALEYAEASFTPDDHAYGSIFYLLTGFHGLHVLAGLVLIGVVMWFWAGPDGGAHILDACAHYWHFVDAVWVAVFVAVYLLP